MCACKLYAFKHKRTHQTKSPFMSVESENCNEITGLDCTKMSISMKKKMLTDSDRNLEFSGLKALLYPYKTRFYR